MCIRFESGIRDDLLKIVDLIKQNHPNPMFKELETGVMYFKIKPEVACTIVPNKMLNVVIEIFGVFQQKSADTAYLQMNVIQVL